MIENNDYVGIKMTKARLEDLYREAKRDHEARELLKQRHVRRRIRLPKITISWN
jgi:hypothetical protein